MTTQTKLYHAYLKELALSVALLILRIGVISRTTYEQIRNEIKKKDSDIETINRILRYRPNTLQYLLKNLSFLVQEEANYRLRLVRTENLFYDLVSKEADATIEKRVDDLQTRQHDTEQADYVTEFKDQIVDGITANNTVRKTEQAQEQAIRDLLDEMKLTAEMKEKLFNLFADITVKDHGLKGIKKNPYSANKHHKNIKKNTKSEN